MKERRHSRDRSAARQLLHSPLLPHQQQRSSLLLQHRQWQREARWRMSEQTTTLPSSSPSAVASGGAAACRRGDRGAPLFFPNGISNGAPPFFPNRALLPPLDCTPSLPPASSRFGPIAASFGATWTRCSLACARRRSSLWVPALAFSPRRFISGVPVSGVEKGLALEERVGELRSRPSGLGSGLSFFYF
jgi:hypothetical protein